ncbi:PhoX family protein [Luedemannella flava]|uniref:PhoX family protein n=1 Tax=Luedemannella flava TaxID=349316 RepID=A0ABP4YCA0_9ACTN
MPEPSRLLPLSGGAHGTARSPMTCLYRCGNACDHPVPNQTDNEYLGDLINTGLSRRGLMRAGALGALVLGVSSAVEAAVPGGAAVAAPTVGAAKPAPGTGELTFKPIPPNKLDTVIVPNGYDHAVVIRWGDEVVPGAPDFDPYNQTAAAQSRQFGYNNDFVAVVPLDRDYRRALLVVNHEYTNEDLMFPGFTTLDALTPEQRRISLAAHGLSVVEIERVDGTGGWQVVRRGSRRYNRRVTALATKFQLTGPAAGSPLLRTTADPTGTTVIGTLNNCAGGVTPWGTILSGEENFNQYFVGGDAAAAAGADTRARLDRYGITTSTRYPSGNRKWDLVDPRFDLALNPNEANRFGWIVELDPFDPDSRPRKHTALGRFKHEGATAILSKAGHAVLYMGDDERFDYLYKFVSSKPMKKGDPASARRHNLTLLESGTLYVAKFGFTSTVDGTGALPADGGFNGTGQWIPLARDGVSLVPGRTIEDVLIFTRQAGDAVGATKLDRPEDVEANPLTGKVYAALTNNTNRGVGSNPGVDEANPRVRNRHGHVIEITEDGDDNAAETFTWDLFLVCGDPADPAGEVTWFAGYDKTKVSPISCPDNVAFDRFGNLWISTDGNALGSNDGLFAVPLEGPERGHVKQFLTVPLGAETCGPALTGDGRSVFVAVQHPGEITGASFDKPASTWPDGNYARPAVVASWRLDGRAVGA